MNKKKKLDDLELVFIDEPWTDEERKSFSAYLRAQKLRSKRKRPAQANTTQKKKHFA